MSITLTVVLMKILNKAIKELGIDKGEFALGCIESLIHNNTINSQVLSVYNETVNSYRPLGIRISRYYNLNLIKRTKNYVLCNGKVIKVKKADFGLIAVCKVMLEMNLIKSEG